MDSFKNYVKVYYELLTEIDTAANSSNSFYEVCKQLTEPRKNSLNAQGYFENHFPYRNKECTGYKDINNLGDNIYVNDVCGIYAFIIRKKDKSFLDNKELADAWCAHRTRNPNLKIPSYYMNRFQNSKVAATNNNNLNNSKMLYIGKSENNLISRVKQHLELENSSTYSLKLNLFLKYNPQYQVMVKLLYSETTTKIDASKTILHLVEKNLHKAFSPLIGTSR